MDRDGGVIVGVKLVILIAQAHCQIILSDFGLVFNQ